MRRRSWCLIAGLVLAGTSCTHRRGTASDARTPGVEDPVHLNVINHYTLPVDVFVIATDVAGAFADFGRPGERR